VLFPPPFSLPFFFFEPSPAAIVFPPLPTMKRGGREWGRAIISFFPFFFPFSSGSTSLLIFFSLFLAVKPSTNPERCSNLLPPPLFRETYPHHFLFFFFLLSRVRMTFQEKQTISKAEMTALPLSFFFFPFFSFDVPHQTRDVFSSLLSSASIQHDRAFFSFLVLEQRDGIFVSSFSSFSFFFLGQFRGLEWLLGISRQNRRSPSPSLFFLSFRSTGGLPRRPSLFFSSSIAAAGR